MEARGMKLVAWTDWFNLLERRGKCGMGSGSTLWREKSGMIGFMSQVKFYTR